MRPLNIYEAEFSYYTASSLLVSLAKFSILGLMRRKVIRIIDPVWVIQNGEEWAITTILNVLHLLSLNFILEGADFDCIISIGKKDLWFLSQNNWKAKSPGLGSWLWSVGFLSLLNRLCPLCISSSGWLGTGSLPGHTQPSSGVQPAKGRTRKNSLLDSSCLRLAANCQLMETFFLIPRRSLSTVIQTRFLKNP